MPGPRLLRIATIPASIQFLLRGQLAYMKEQGFRVYAASAIGEEVKDIVREGIPHYAIPFTRSITPVQDMICLVQLILLMIKLRPDIVHTHTPKAGLLGMLAARICGVKVRMHTVAGLPLMEATGVIKKVLIRAERMTYAAATHVYPNSKGLSDFIHDHLHPNSVKFNRIGHGSSNGIDVTYFQRTETLLIEAEKIKRHYLINPDEICFCFVGRLVPDKGVVELVQAFRKIRQQEKVKLLLVGSFERKLDPLPKETDDFIRSSVDVILTGFQQDVRPFMLAADAFVFPSYREGFPNVVLQACSLELPCIATNINGCNEILQDNYSGRLVKPKDTMELEGAMVDFIRNKSQWNRYGKRAREYVIANFERKTYWNLLVKEYELLYNEHVRKVH